MKKTVKLLFNNDSSEAKKLQKIYNNNWILKLNKGEKSQVYTGTSVEVIRVYLRIIYARIFSHMYLYTCTQQLMLVWAE